MAESTPQVESLTEPLPEPLPEPLTIQAALAQVDRQPELLAARAAIRRGQAGQGLARVDTDLRVNATGTLAVVEPNPVSADRRSNDSRLSLVAHKRLYDFGRSAANIEAASQQLEGAKTRLQARRQAVELTILSRYLKVLEADLASAWRREGMSIAFIRYDRLKDRNELGQVSDVELLKAEAVYQQWRGDWIKAEAQQRVSRAALAIAMNRPGQLASDVLPVVVPKGSAEEGSDSPPELEQLVAEVLKDNPQLQALSEEVAQWQAKKRAARAGGAPQLDLEASWNQYHRDTSGRDRWSLGLSLDVPLVKDSSVDARMGLAEAGYLEAVAAWQQKQLDLRLQTRELWEALTTTSAQVEAAQLALDSRDLILDRSRALYELEVQADLGNSLVSWSQARLKLAEARHAQLLVRARLKGLRGQSLAAWLTADLQSGPSNEAGVSK